MIFSYSAVNGLFYINYYSKKRPYFLGTFLIILFFIFSYSYLFNSMGYIVPFLTISSILIDVCFTNLIFIGAIFNSYNYWYLLSYSNQFTLHYSILFLIISIIIIPLIYCYFSYYIKIISALSSLILSSFFYHFTFFIPIFLDFFLIFSIFFFKGPINSIEVFIGFNPCYSILFINFFSLFFQIQFIILLFFSFHFFYYILLFILVFEILAFSELIILINRPLLY